MYGNSNNKSNNQNKLYKIGIIDKDKDNNIDRNINDDNQDQYNDVDLNTNINDDNLLSYIEDNDDEDQVNINDIYSKKNINNIDRTLEHHMHSLNRDTMISEINEINDDLRNTGVIDTEEIKENADKIKDNRNYKYNPSNDLNNDLSNSKEIQSQMFENYCNENLNKNDNTHSGNGACASNKNFNKIRKNNNLHYVNSSNNKNNEIDLVKENQYISELKNRVNQAHKERAKLETNVNLLHSRIRVLSQEEKKSLSKVKITKNKANERKAVLNKNNSMINIKQQYKINNQLKLQEQKQQNQQQREQLKANLEKNKQELIRNKSKNAEFRKSQKNLHSEIKKIIKDEEIIQKKAKNSVIKTCLEIGEMKKKLSIIEKKNRLKEFLSSKILNEKNAIETNQIIFSELIKDEEKCFDGLMRVQAMESECKFLYY